MRRVYVDTYAHATVGPGAALRSPPALTRRMSWMQKAAMEALAALEAPPADAAVYFATQFGEVDATLTVAASILSRQLPVSPTAFQHSVHNAVPGYVTIACESRAPSLTVSAGFASFDKLLFWAFHELRAGLLDRTLLVYGSERLGPEPGEMARCEMLLLSAGLVNALPRTELRSVTRASSRAALDLLMKDLGPGAAQEFHETEGGVAEAPLRLDRTDGTFHRILTSFAPETSGEFPFEAYVSTWSRPA